MLKSMNVLSLCLVLTGISAHAETSFQANKTMIVKELQAKYGAAKSLNLDLALSMLQVPEKLGLINVTDTYGISGMNGDGGGQNGPDLSVKNDLISMENSAGTYQGARSMTFCSAQTIATLETLKAKNEFKALWAQINQSCLEVYVMANMARGERLENLNYAYSYDLKTGQLKMAQTQRTIRVYILDRSKGEVAGGYSGDEPFLGKRTDKNADFELSESFKIRKNDIVENLFTMVKAHYDSAYNMNTDTANERDYKIKHRLNLEEAVATAGLSSETLAGLKKMAQIQRDYAILLEESVAAVNKRMQELNRMLDEEEENALVEVTHSNAALKKLNEQQNLVLKSLIKNKELKALATIVSKIN